MKADAGAQNADGAGQLEPAVAEDVGDGEPGENAAQNVQRPGGQPANQQKSEICGAVFDQIADVFKRGESDGNGDGRAGQYFCVRLKNQIEEKQRHQLQNLFADRHCVSFRMYTMRYVFAFHGFR